MDKFRRRSKDEKFSNDSSTNTTTNNLVPSRVRRDAHFLNHHTYHTAAAVELDTSGNGLHPYEEDYATMLGFSIFMLILILITLPLLLCFEHGSLWCKRKRGVRRVVSDAATGNEDYLDMTFSDDFENPANNATADAIRFTHNDKEFEIVEQANKGVQTDPETNTRADEILRRTAPRTQGFAKGTATEPQPQQQTNNNKQQQTNHDLAEIIELKRQKGVGNSKTASNEKATIGVGNDDNQNIPSERYYYTRPVQEQRSVGGQFSTLSRDNGVQACIYDMIRAETKCQQTLPNNNKCRKKSAPAHQDQRIISECTMLKTGISTRFQPAISCNTICPRRLPQEPSRGRLNICREDFRTLSRCAHLTWSDVIDRTENTCRSSSNEDENQNQQCCRRVDTNYEPHLSDNCPVERNNVCRVSSERDKKSWFSWW